MISLPKGWLIALLLLVLLLAAWLSMMNHSRNWVKQPSDIEVAQAWVQCLDCRGPFLKRIRQSDQDTVTRFLRSALLYGPDSAQIEAVERDLAKAWRADSSYRAGSGLTPDTAQQYFMARYRSGFVVRWRGRAAIALGVIRTKAALAALDSALQVPPQNHGDSTVLRWAKRARSDLGISALGHYP